MTEWRETTLGDVIQLQRGFDLTERESEAGLYPVISSSGVNYYTATPKVLGPGVVTGRKGVLGKVHFSAGPYWPHDTTLWVKDFRGNDPRFIYYWLQTIPLAGLDGGAANPTLNRNHAHLLQVRVPDRALQIRIAEILTSFDDLIENHRQRITLLEQMARAIYQEWFVHFRYSGHEDDDLVDSPVGLIPAGWNVSTLGDRLGVLESGSRPRGGIDPKERGVPSVGAENILGPGRYRFDAEKYVTESFYESMRRGRVKDGDVLLYKDGAHIGRHSLFRDGFPHSRCVINEHVFRLQARPPISQSYLYFWIDRPETVEDIVSLNSNAAQPGLSQAKVATLAMIVPKTRVLKEWDEAVEPLLKLLFGLAKQNRQLVEMRDLLLPGLVSGAIDVSRLVLDDLPE